MARRKSRFPLRAAIAWQSLGTAIGRAPPKKVERVLIAHNLLLGDTLMLASLLAGLRAQYPKAILAMTCAEAFLPLYEGHPYGVEAIPFDPREPESLTRIAALGPFDLAIVPGESRHGWLARAAGARWVRGYRGGAWYYQAALDERCELPDHLQPLVDIMGGLAKHDPGLFNPSDWPSPAPGSFKPPDDAYAVFHLGAGSPLKYWPPERWHALAETLVQRFGLIPVLSAGPGQEGLVRAADPRRQFLEVAGRLDLRDMWQLLKKATLLVSPDTGIAHLARLTKTPSVVLFGPGQAGLYGPGRFFADTAYRAVTIAEMSCRNETRLFERTRPWIRTCVRAPSACHFKARCSTGISVESVISAIHEVLKTNGA